MTRAVKEAVSLRLDADVLAWLKKDGAGYQTRGKRLIFPSSRIDTCLRCVG